MIEQLFRQCRAEGTIDKEIAKQLAISSNLIPTLAQFYKHIAKESEDAIILYNWMIGRTFNVCINELRDR